MLKNRKPVKDLNLVSQHGLVIDRLAKRQSEKVGGKKLIAWLFNHYQLDAKRNNDKLVTTITKNLPTQAKNVKKGSYVEAVDAQYYLFGFDGFIPPWCNLDFIESINQKMLDDLFLMYSQNYNHLPDGEAFKESIRTQIGIATMALLVKERIKNPPVISDSMQHTVSNRLAAADKTHRLDVGFRVYKIDEK